MENGNSIIYGLEHQSRALAPQVGENDAIRFFIGTQCLKPNSNQIHIVELEEETGALHTKVYQHDLGEIWHIRCSPHDASSFVSCYYNPMAGQFNMGTALLKLPNIKVISDDTADTITTSGVQKDQLEIVQIYDVEKYGPEVKCTEFHMTETNRLAIVVDNSVVIFDVNGTLINHIQLEGKGHLKFSGGKWNPHQNGQQFVAMQDTHLKSYDTRNNSPKPAWSLDSAHNQHLRDLDFNPNKQFHLATVADDGCLKIWDYRKTKEPVFLRSDHSHWVWAVRFNTFHDQLLLTGSSDARVLLTSAASISSEAISQSQHRYMDANEELDDTDKDTTLQESDDSKNYESNIELSVSDSDATPDHNGANKEKLIDGVLQYYEQHEDSVYCVEWSSADPWTFASLSYDGRLVISRVPKHYKYKILL
ncbi:EARP and GARP complex-interacting protein 1 [Arctopsyche grandis]|uniref:EARP and GARP complex-interacting protein 1 n=1 Tax=Arctopsyche grandis TaxID=121162 RepID=UPI00406D67DD